MQKKICFLEVLNNIEMYREEGDSRLWAVDESDLFSVKTTYKMIFNTPNTKNCNLFYTLWSIKVVPSALTQAWRTLFGKLATRDNVIRRGVALSSSVCPLYKEEEEIVEHLFLQIKFSSLVWNKCYRWIDIMFEQHDDLRCHFEQSICIM